VILGIPRTVHDFLYLLGQDFIFYVNLMDSPALKILRFFFVDFDGMNFRLIVVDRLHVPQIVFVASHVNFNLFFFHQTIQISCFVKHFG
jgi:hypothetical protein